ncbi:MAG TPA: STAS/SEC14 domain-containing protein [Candidatus Wirthbacteria bacterium]|nr:STAS/SEC14 domain-containing protein [Candidatus Wirthbacteria bacterium]
MDIEADLRSYFVVLDKLDYVYFAFLKPNQHPERDYLIAKLIKKDIQSIQARQQDGSSLNMLVELTAIGQDKNLFAEARDIYFEIAQKLIMGKIAVVGHGSLYKFLTATFAFALDPHRFAWFTSRDQAENWLLGT